MAKLEDNNWRQEMDNEIGTQKMKNNILNTKNENTNDTKSDRRHILKGTLGPTTDT